MLCGRVLGVAVGEDWARGMRSHICGKVVVQRENVDRAAKGNGESLLGLPGQWEHIIVV